MARSAGREKPDGAAEGGCGCAARGRMGLRGCWGRAWLLGAAALLLPGGCSDSSSTKHSYSVFWTGVSEPGQTSPWFIAVMCMDNQLISVYNGNGKLVLPRVPWMEMWEKEDPQLWQGDTDRLWVWELALRKILDSVQNIYNHSQGLHTLQVRTGCELTTSGQRGGHYLYGYDGRDFITLDNKTLGWITVNAEAESITKTWTAAAIPRLRAFVDEECVERLQKHLLYGKKALQRRDPPVVKVTHKESEEGLEILLCQAYGFYSKEIDVTWRKDGEVLRGDTLHGIVSPNADGTFYTWHSIKIHSKERNRYQCQVKLDRLQEPLIVDVVKPALMPLGLLVGVVLMTLISLLLIGIIFYIRVGKKLFRSLLSSRPPPAHLQADLSCPPASFQGGAKLEPAEEESVP